MKIKNIEILHFRGVPNSLFVDFSDKGKKPVSVIISGDNGAGKSSILDAIEYNLQGRICREPLKITSESRMPLSLRNRPLLGCNTIVELDNGDRVERGINVVFSEDKTEYKIDNSFLHRSFSMSPIVLRRNDIISFSIMPKEKRQVLFFSFLYQNYVKIEDAINNWIHWEGDQHLTLLKDEYVRLKQERKELVRKLSELLNDNIDNIPFSVNEKLRRFILIKKGKNFFDNIKNHKNTFQNQRFIIRKNLDIFRLYKDIVNINEKILGHRHKMEQALNPNVYGVKIKERREQNAELIKSTESMLTVSFREVSNLDFIEEIHLELGTRTDASLEILIKLKNGRWATPQQVFSEANFDLLILLLYLSIIRVSVEKGQAKVLILDDVMQSVDSVIRAKFMDFVLKVCKDWQLIVSCHDDLWKQQLEYLFIKHGHSVKKIRLVNWSFQDGPQIVDETSQMSIATLEQAIATNNKQIIASQAGLFLEYMCQQLSMSLSISIHRRINDKYTIGDLWPGIMSSLKKTNLKPLLDEISRDMMARNMLGCHANEWAQSMSESEILSFARNLRLLYEKTYCQNCHQWITNMTCSGDFIAECKCRKIQYVKDKTSVCSNS